MNIDRWVWERVQQSMYFFKKNFVKFTKPFFILNFTFYWIILPFLLFILSLKVPDKIISDKYGIAEALWLQLFNENSLEYF